ncbi:hypothetical protein B0T18DRAFT_416147 [Schizothecium vesticola]|uniref:Apple domain-containing protein n=1 Tax=Schizothecium vesticola TaxID=314040 RepID=A0AA40ER17_9PEZI|nr:hypothetical protein B0T18DRAFT_416147 [Schizothecium vesticola]
MCRIAVFATAALGLLPTAFGYSAPIGPPKDSPIGLKIGHGSCAGRALDYLVCHHPQSPACIEKIAVQAAAFCSSFLSETATVFNTVTDISTATSTATEVFTSDAIATATSTSTTETIETVIVTLTSISTSTFFVSTSYVTPSDTPFVPSVSSSVPLIKVKVKHRDTLPTSCPDLHKRALTRRPAVKLSSVCSCLGITAATTTTTDTLTTSTTTTEDTTVSTTTTETSTTTQIEISVSTTTTETTTTITSGTVATETAIVDYCDLTYNGGGVTPGNNVIRPPGDLDGRQCCVLCWNTLNCVASAIGLGYCQLLVKTSPLEGAPTNLQCPLGIENYTYVEGPGTLYRGPCSPGLN